MEEMDLILSMKVYLVRRQQDLKKETKIITNFIRELEKEARKIKNLSLSK